MDIMPTCLELTGTLYPSIYKGSKITPMDGHSLVPVMKGKEKKPYQNLFFEHEGGRALISGEYKIVALKRGKWAMYNLNIDKTESNNLIEKETAKAKELIDKWQVWANEMGLK
jgi:arylsulfatase